MFQIDNFSRVPIYEQLIEQFERFILTGALPPGERIPSVRSLSVKLSINPNTVQKAYSELDSRALIYSLPGKGSFVAEDAPQKISAHRAGNLSELSSIVMKLKEAGIKREEIERIIDKFYNREEE